MSSAASPGELAAALAGIEARLMALGEALCTPHGATLAEESAALQRAMAALLPLLRDQPPALNATLRRRIAHCASQVAAQREALARAAALSARTLDVLLPQATVHAGYSAHGVEQRRAHRGALQA